MTPNDLLKKYEKALEIQNWHDVEPLLHRDAGVTFSSGTFKDKKEVQHAFENTFNLIKEEKYSITNVTWIHSDVTFAVCLYNFNWRGLINGKHSSRGARGTCALIYSSDQW